jgi:HK97 family phage portal protein
MGIFEKFKNKLQGMRYAHMLNSGQPIFSQFGDNIYASDIVQSVIDCIVSEMTKLTPLHVRKMGMDRTPVKGNIQKMLDNPNPLMTKADFMSKVIWNLFLNCNSIIYPTYRIKKNKDGTTEKEYTALYPLQPKYVTFEEDGSGQLFIKMQFENMQEFTLPYEDVIHIRYKFSFNDFLGGNKSGQPDNDALLKLLSMNENMMEGVLKALKTSFNINGILKSGSMMDKDKVDKMVAEFNEKLKNNESGILGVDGKSDYVAITQKIQLIDEKILRFIDERILRKFGVSLAILNGDYTKEQYEAFYQKVIEPLIIAISQAFEKTLFTKREKEMGNSIVFLPRALIFMNTTQILEAIRLLGDRGELFGNENRMAIGLEPLEELVGVRMQSLNYINTEYAKEYQLKDIKTEGENGE